MEDVFLVEFCSESKIFYFLVEEPWCMKPKKLQLKSFRDILFITNDPVTDVCREVTLGDLIQSIPGNSLVTASSYLALTGSRLVKIGITIDAFILHSLATVHGLELAPVGEWFRGHHHRRHEYHDANDKEDADGDQGLYDTTHGR